MKIKMRIPLRKGGNILLLWVGGRFTGLAGGKIPMVPEHISRKHTSTIASQIIYHQSLKKTRPMIRLEKYIATHLSEDTYVHMSIQNATDERQPMRVLPVIPHDMLTSLLPDLIIFFQPEKMDEKHSLDQKHSLYTKHSLNKKPIY